MNGLNGTRPLHDALMKFRAEILENCPRCPQKDVGCVDIDECSLVADVEWDIYERIKARLIQISEGYDWL